MKKRILALALVLAVIVSLSALAPIGGVAFNTADFTDIEAINNMWHGGARPHIEFVVSRGLYRGNLHADGRRSFAPESTMTRAQFIAVISNHSGIGQNFTSFPAQHISWAESLGIFGTSASARTEPSNPITRADMAYWLYNYINVSNINLGSVGGTPLQFSDISLNILPQGHIAAINILANAGISGDSDSRIISGFPDTTFRPAATSTRAEVAAIIAKFVRAESASIEAPGPSPSPSPEPSPSPSPEPSPLPTPIPEPTPDLIPEPTPDLIPEPTSPPPAPQMDADEFERRVFELVNIERANNDLNPLEWHPVLAQAAREHSQDMAINDFMSHESFNGQSFSDRMRALNLPGMFTWAENVAAGRNTPEAAVEGWMNSQGHRNNILNPTLTHLGVGFAHHAGSQWQGIRWTQKFAAFV